MRIYLFLFLATLLAGLPAYGQVGSGIITMTTAKNVGEELSLDIRADGDITIEGVKGKAQKGYSGYTIINQQIVIRGNITALDCSWNRLTALDVLGCPTLKTLDCSENGLTNLNVSGCTSLTELNCRDNQLTNLNVSGCTSLTELICYKNKLTALDVSGCTALTKLYCCENQLITLDVSGCTLLTELICYKNKLTALDVSGCTALTTLNCHSNQLTALDASGCTELTSLCCSWNQLTSLNVLSCTELTKLECSNNRLTSLDVSGCTELTELYCNNNQLTSLNVSGYTDLTKLYCNNNQLTSLNVLGCTALRELNCGSNKAPLTLNASGCTALTSLYCNDNQLTSLNVSGCTALTSLYCNDNQLTSLNVSGCTELTKLDCSQNQIKADEMTILVKRLPNRQGQTHGNLYISSNNSDEGNVCYRYHVTLAKEKNWKLYGSGKKIEGMPNPIYVITQRVEGKGLLKLNGADDLNAVEYGTELTIEDTPEEGYELTALTANGADILATMKFVVTCATEVKATFAKKTFTVKLTKEGEGTLTATGAGNLNAVPYGTELTIEATPAAGYTLVALIANGTDILATRKVVVKESTEVKATFAKKTFAVKLTKEGEGTLNATGADKLNEVEYGTELTIEATPAEEYTLVALTANGADILATKKVVVKEATEVKATFAKKTFGVTLTREGEGTLNATGADNLNAVAYGTELTIEATPAEGYYLMALTANGTDILATKKVVVKEATEVKATFAKKTFGVTLSSNELGSISIVESVDLKAIPYGTELTVKAQARDAKYELKALTANGVDILATKKFIVTGFTVVKATFTKPGFAVTLTKEGEGTLNATGTDDLTAVPEGTELTIEATPAEGYYLMALTANGTNILTTKKVVVKGATEVKATFAKKTFAVTLTKEGEGTLKATGANDLTAVPYGTELTIEATPAEGYELKALTANGNDILATKQFVVKGATEIKATFTKKTAADRVEAGSVRLYPNPASTYVNVKAAKADALVRLYDANGTLLYEARTDDHGMLQIELSAYAEGTYLLLVDSNAQRLLIQR